jgi:uncharacterized membrane protein YfhO
MVLTSADNVLGRAPVEGDEREDLRELRNLVAAQPIGVELEEYRPNALRFWVEAPSDGWLMIMDRYAPGWNVSVDGREVDLVCAGLIFRGLAITGGRHYVEFAFRPWGYPWLLALSYGMWVTLALVSLVASARKRLQATGVGSLEQMGGGS